MTASLPSGMATGIGSVPHGDPAAAVRFVLEHLPGLPAAPQLPRRSPLEGMVAQAAAGIPGVRVRPDGSLAVDRNRLDPTAPIADEDLPFAPGTAAALIPFLDAVSARRRPVKLQLTGPVTLGMALTAAGAPPGRAFAVATAAVRARGRALVGLTRSRAPQAPLLVLLDEPGLVAAARPGFPLEREPMVDVLSSALAALTPAVAGVHCCGDTDWRLAVDAGARVLSMPLVPAAVDEAGLLGSYLDGGGWVAWGAVPTSGPVGDAVEPLWRRLMSVWCDLTQAGVDPILLRRQALVTPACGLAHHGASQADRTLRLTAELAARVREQAVATRLSVGA